MDLHFAIFPIGELDALRHNKNYEPWTFPLEKYVHKYTCKYLFIMFVFDFSLQFEGIFFCLMLFQIMEALYCSSLYIEYNFQVLHAPFRSFSFSEWL